MDIGMERAANAPYIRAILKKAPSMFEVSGNTTAPSAGVQGGFLEGSREKLKTVAPQLTPRELEVCIRIMWGISSEGIGIDLGISRNTVLTYRKRAYARLNISSQNQLFQMVM